MARVTTSVMALVLLVLGCNTGSPTAPTGQLSISPDTVTVESGRSLQLTVTDGEGQQLVDGVVWRSSNVAAVRVDAAGVVTGEFANGAAIVTATFGAAQGSVEASTVPRLCFAIAPLDGTPDPDESIQTFAVEFEPGVDPARRTAELEQRFGFAAIEVTASGFTAALTADQAGNVQCARDVAGMTYI